MGGWKAGESRKIGSHGRSRSDPNNGNRERMSEGKDRSEGPEISKRSISGVSVPRTFASAKVRGTDTKKSKISTNNSFRGGQGMIVTRGDEKDIMITVPLSR